MNDNGILNQEQVNLIEIDNDIEDIETEFEEQGQQKSIGETKVPKRFIAPAGYAAEANFWDRIYANMRMGHTVTGNIASISYAEAKPVWDIIFSEWPDVQGIVPQEETPLNESVFYKFVGQDVFLRIKGCDPDNGIIACSYNDAVDAVRDKVYLSIKESQTIPVVVKAIANNPSRLVVDVGGGVLVDISAKNAKRYYSRYLSEQFKPGQQVNAVVINKKPLALSIKATYPDPWLTYSFERGQIIVGNVIMVKGDYMRIEPDRSPGLTGTAPIPLLGSILPGDRVQCSVTRFLRNERKFNLNVKARLFK